MPPVRWFILGFWVCLFFFPPIRSLSRFRSGLGQDFRERKGTRVPDQMRRSQLRHDRWYKSIGLGTSTEDERKPLDLPSIRTNKYTWAFYLFICRFRYPLSFRFQRNWTLRFSTARTIPGSCSAPSSKTPLNCSRSLSICFRRRNSRQIIAQSSSSLIP